MPPRTADLVRRLMDNVVHIFDANALWLDNAQNTKTIREIKRRIRNMEDKFAEYTALAQELMSIDPDETGDNAVQVESDYLSLISRFETLLDTMEPEQPEGSEYRTAPFPQVTTRLPKLPMPQFDGNATNWASFIQRFTSAVSSPHLSNLNRLEHLLSCVKGDAASLLENYQVVEANYEHALKALRDRYENKRLLLRLYLQKLFQLPQVTNNNEKSLRDVINCTISNVRAIENLEFKRDSLSNELLAQLVVSKLDTRTKELWETHVSESESSTINNSTQSSADDVIDSYSDLTKFLESRLRVVSSVFASSTSASQKTTSTPPTASSRNSPGKTTPKTTLAVQAQTSETTRTCPYCSSSHALFQCESFKKLPVTERYSKVRDLKVCVNCFSGNHWAKQCKSSRCKSCGKLHHTLLHSSELTTPPAQNTPPSTSSVPESSSTVPPATSAPSTGPSSTSSTTAAAVISAVAQRRAKEVLLSTAVVQASSASYQSPATALLDGASHISMITSSLATQLQLKLTKTTTTISGVGGQQSVAVAAASFRITSHDGEFSKVIRATVVDHVTDPLPTESFEIPKSWSFTTEFCLANPEFNRSQPIDILIGADYLYDILLPGMEKPPSGPILLSSHLGWLVGGPCSAVANDTSLRCLATTATKAEIINVSRFLGLEEQVTQKESRTADEIECEQHYERTYRRDETGRFVLSLPRRTGVVLGESRTRAVQCLKRGKVTPEYTEFLNEYERLGHMSPCDPPEPNREYYYMSHHAVYHNGKIRVVFNASMPSTNGLSLNNAILVGPIVQNKLSVILTLFRTHRYAFTGDMAKMYRQILRAVPDRDLQRIVVLVNGAIRDYCMNTVTYGQASAPYEATRTVVQLARDGQERFPAAAAALLEETYMDDCLSGAYLLSEAQKLRDELSELLGTAGIDFSPTKWRANHPELLLEPPVDPTQLLSNGNALGLKWDTTQDEFIFSNLTEFEWSEELVTRRNAYSFVSRIFDPLGLLSPLTIACKLFIQKLWNGNKHDWDVQIESEYEKEFLELRSRIAIAATISIPRYLATDEPGSEFELHGFGDASKQAYSACIYVRSVHENQVVVCLVQAKTRVAPLSQRRTVPQLELCAADLLVELFKDVTSTLKYPMEKCRAYTDSTIVLAYLSKEPGHWKPYEANRVRRILESIPRVQWSHVPGEQNPADLATRDDSFTEFMQRQSLWIQGPEFLQSLTLSELPSPTTDESSVARVLVTSVAPKFPHLQLVKFESIFHKFSRYDRLRRAVTNLSRRFSVLGARMKKEPEPEGPLTVAELDKASEFLIRVAQARCFTEDLKSLVQKGTLPKESQLNSLNPILDRDILRVGGRLENSELEYQEKHPIILKASHRLTLLLIREAHHQNAHAGSRFITSLLQRKYWIVGKLQVVIQKCLSSCARCIRHLIRKPSIPIMGDLPTERVTVSMPFQHIGVDYAGPIWTRSKARSVRGPVTKIKSYFCVFVCMATKAIHLEVVSEASTAAFMATLRRFVARRGLPSSITSDNGTNFVGADAEMQRELTELSKHPEVQNFSSNLGVTWKFNPPSAPHMGGLYEAAVKSTKYHFKRVVGTQLLTFEELTTLLCQIESILNSRPISPMAQSNKELDVLTPAHFLIGRPLIDVPGDIRETSRLSYSDRFRLIQELRNSFWSKWSRDYLRTLQCRYKWQTSSQPFKVGDVVLLVEDSSAPLVWPLGLIVKSYPGSDGNIRVVDVRVRNGTVLRRPVAKLVHLIEDPEVVSTT